MRIDDAQIGFLAEDMDKVIPEVVSKDSEGKPANIAYAKLTSVLTKAIQQIWQDMQPVIARVAGLKKGLTHNRNIWIPCNKRLTLSLAEFNEKEGQIFRRYDRKCDIRTYHSFRETHA